MVKDNNAPVDTEGEQFRKLFIGGLSSSSTEESMKDYYSQFGDVTDTVVMRDGQTKRSRGFGFVTFSKSADVDAAMESRPHEFDGKTVDPKRAVPREASNRGEAQVSSTRLYVSGVREGHTEDMFREHFGEYGKISKCEIVTDKATNKPRGFAFITFDDYDSVDKCVLKKSHMINGQRCDVKKALSKDEMSKGQQGDRDRGMRGDRSRGGQGGYDRGSQGGYGGRGGEQWGAPGGGWGSQQQSGGWGAPQGGGRGGGWGAPQGGYGGGGREGGWAGSQGGYGGGGQGGWGAQQQGGWGGAPQQGGGGGGWARY